MWFCCIVYQRFKTDTLKIISPNLHMILTLSPPSIHQKSQTLGLPHASVSSWSLQSPPFVLGTSTTSPFPSTVHPIPQLIPPQVNLLLTDPSIYYINLCSSLKCSESPLKTNSLVSISTHSSNWTCFSLAPIFPIIFHLYSFYFPPLIPWIMNIARILTLLFVTANALYFSYIMC